MARVLIRCYWFPRYIGPDENSHYTIRLSIFLIYAECTGAAALLWALIVLHRHRKHKGRIPAFVIIVLLNNLLELLLNPYIITKLIKGDCHCIWYEDTTCRALFSLWATTVTYGVLLQQMMVLESVLTLRHPSCSAHVFFTPCSFIFYFIIFFCVFLSELFSVPQLLIVVNFLSVTVVLWIVVCRKPPNENISNRTKKPDCTLLAFTTTTLIIYLICIILAFDLVYLRNGPNQNKSWKLLRISICLSSLRVMVDPVLCVLVCKQKTAVEAEQSV